MTPAFDKLLQELKRLPGLGYRSAERVAMHLLVEHPERLPDLVEALQDAGKSVGRCAICGNIAEAEVCAICADGRRDPASVCVVEHVPDLAAIERSGAWTGCYHVLQGKLSPIRGIGPGELNFDALERRIADGPVTELVLALSNDIEGQATCHFIQEELVKDRPVKVTRIGFGLPSGGGVTYADSITLRSALEGRRDYH